MYKEEDQPQGQDVAGSGFNNHGGSFGLRFLHEFWHKLVSPKQPVDKMSSHLKGACGWVLSLSHSVCFTLLFSCICCTVTKKNK
jgi:hypothetical protein